MKKIDARALDEQVIAVPKGSLDRVSKRCPRRLPWRVVERLVEVPTIISYSSLQQRTSEQIIDIPVPQGRGSRGGHGGLQGVSQGQGSTALCGADPVDIPVPRSGGLQGFLQRQGPTASSSSSHFRAGAADELFQGVFRTFPQMKKVRGWVRTRGRNCVRTLIHGLLRLMPSPWRALTTSLRRSRSRSRRRRRRWRRAKRLALQPGFGLCGSARGSSSTSWDGQCGGVPMAIGAPSHTYGLSFTRKPQLMNNSSPRAFLTEVVVAASGPGERWPREERWCGAAVQMTVKMVVDVPVHFNDKFPQSWEFVLKVPQIQFDLRGWDFPVVTQRQVPTVHTPRSGAVLGVVAVPVVVQQLAPGSGQFRQLWLLFFFWRWNGGRGSLLRPGVGAHHTGDEFNQSQRLCCMHRHVVVDIHALVVNPLQQQQQQ